MPATAPMSSSCIRTFPTPSLQPTTRPAHAWHWQTSPGSLKTNNVPTTEVENRILSEPCPLLNEDQSPSPHVRQWATARDHLPRTARYAGSHKLDPSCCPPCR